MHPRKRIILKEAASLFRIKSFEATTLRELAEHSGIKGGSIYYHFSSKQEILLNMMDFSMSELIFTVKEAVKNKKNSIEKLREAIKTHIEYHINNLDMTVVADSEIRSLTEENHRFIIQKRKKYEKIFSEIIEEGLREGVFHIKETKITTFAILQMCTGVSYWYKEQGSLNVQDIVDVYFDFIYAGVLGLCGIRTDIPRLE